MKDNPNIQDYTQQLYDRNVGTAIPESLTPTGFFAAIWEPAGVAEGDHRYFVERDGRHFLRILHQVGEDEQVYLLEVFPDKNVL